MQLLKTVASVQYKFALSSGLLFVIVKVQSPPPGCTSTHRKSVDVDKHSVWVMATVHEPVTVVRSLDVTPCIRSVALTLHSDVVAPPTEKGNEFC